MKVSGIDGLQLTYCLNVHPGETLDSLMDAILMHTTRVRDAVCPNGRFGVGLRMGHRTAWELEAGRLESLKSFLDSQSMYVFTINGFPYGQFHGSRVKEDVYRPDWLDSARVSYTKDLIRILAGLLDEGEEGSISTVPISYRGWITDKAMVGKAVQNLAECAWTAWKVGNSTGRMVTIALEPEPDCWIDTTSGMIDFMQKDFLPTGMAYLVDAKGVSVKEAEGILSRHVGVCLDTCHSAVQFEKPSDAIKQYRAEGVRILKIQLSAAVSALLNRSSAARLESFIDPVYLHQTRIRRPDGEIKGYPDLDRKILSDASLHGGELRTHFHIPLHFEGDGIIESTTSVLDKDFFDLLREGVTSHLEVETYTFNVLPEAIRGADLADSIVGELSWVTARL